jgi:hypothetical protein
MNSPISLKILNRPSILIFGALLINANTALATNRVGDAQMQARDLLSGTVGGRTKTIGKSLAISADHHQASYPDSQEQARRLMLGNPSFDSTAGREVAAHSKTNVAIPVSARQNVRVQSDAQESARRIILGAGGSDRESAGARLSGIRKEKK